MRKAKILGIAPYEGLNDLMKNVAARRDDIELTVYTGDLMNGLQIMEQEQDKSYDAIVSRGGTAELLRQHSQIPVCEISFSVYDVLRAIRLAQNFSSRLAILGFPSITDCARMLCDLLQYDIRIQTITDEQAIRSVLEELKAQGYRQIVGDMMTVSIAQELDMNGILILSGIESIDHAFDQAIRLYRRNSRLKEDTLFYKALLEADEEILCAMNQQKEILYCNRDTLPEKVPEVLEKLLPDVCTGDIQRYLLRSGNFCYDIRCRLFANNGETLVLFRMTQSETYSRDQKFGAVFINREEAMSQVPSASWRNSARIRSTMDEARKYALTDKPILILGEIGTGKDLMSYYLFQNTQKRFNNRPLVLIDFTQITEKQFSNLLDDISSPLFGSQTTIILRCMNEMTNESYRRLIRVLNGSGCFKRNKVLFVFREDETLREEAIMSEFTNIADKCLIIHMPSLRDRTEDIPGLIAEYLNELNIELGTQVVGLTSDALHLFQSYPWPRNLNQMHHALRSLALNAKTSYISAEETRQVLSRAETAVQYNGEGLPIDLSRPLREIEKEIVRFVVREEGMNQSKAAERLDISRSTVWRFMKD